MTPARPSLPLRDISRCFVGAVPAVIATASADGTPNVTFLSRVHMVDDDHVALSNQFFSKTSRNLAENPRASVLLLDPLTYDQYRLTLVYEQTFRRGPVFDRLRADIDALAALEGMAGIFKLRAADVYRVEHIEHMATRRPAPAASTPPPARPEPTRDVAIAELTGRLGRAADLDTLVGAAVDGLAELLGYEHCALLLLDETGRRLYTIASHGFDAQGVGSEVTVGEGIIGMAAARAAPIRLGNLRQMAKYGWAVRRSYEEHDGQGPGCEIPLPTMPEAQSRVAVPAMALGELVGVLAVESPHAAAFTDADQAALSVVASVIAHAVELERARAAHAPPDRARPTRSVPSTSGDAALHVKFYEVDGSTFLDGDYLIKGVAGRILWSLLREHHRDGRVEFTNREVRLDPTLELPEFRDNFESRLILLKRRLDERDSPIRIEKTGRGRFRLVVARPVRVDCVAQGDGPV